MTQARDEKSFSQSDVCGCSIMPILGGQNGNSGLKVVFFDTDWLINRVANIRVTLWQWA
jgi:hypothetical protein